MKNKTLVFGLILFVGMAIPTKSLAIENVANNVSLSYEYGNSFTFTENGITFAVFQNGEFDFYINQRRGFDFGYRSRGVNITFNSGYNFDAYVQYDDYGAIIQIENTPVYYDYYGRVNRIGNVNIWYNQNRLSRIGGLRVFYNNYGQDCQDVHR